MSGRIDPRPARPVLVAPVEGFSAFVIAKLLEEQMPSQLIDMSRRVEQGRLDPALLVEARHTWAAVNMAASQWTTWRASADGSAEALPAEMPQSSDSWIDTTAAADLLRVSPSRVRQLVRGGQLAARQTGRIWLVRRADCEVRRAAA